MLNSLLSLLLLPLITATTTPSSVNAPTAPIHVLALDGTTYLTSRNSSSILRSLDQSFSIEIWIRLDQAPTNVPERRAFVAALADVGDVEGGAHVHNARGWWLGLDRQSRLSFGCTTKGDQKSWNKQAETVVHSPMHLVVGDWYYVVVTYDSSTGLGKLFANGRAAGSRSLGKGGTYYGDIGEDNRDLPSVTVLRYKDRNVDQRMAASIGSIGFWKTSLKSSAVAIAAKSMQQRDDALVREASRAIPSTKLVSFFRFEVGHGSMIDGYGYTSSFVDGNNPKLIVVGPTAPMWIADSLHAPPLLPIPKTKFAQRGENDATSNQTAARIADVSIEGLALGKKRSASLAIPAVIAAKVKATVAEKEVVKAQLAATTTADQLDRARAYVVMHRDDKEDDGGLATIIRDIAEVHHASKITKLMAARRKANAAALAHRRAAEAQVAIASAARALADGYSVLHGLSKDVRRMMTTMKTDGGTISSLSAIQERLSLGVSEIQREMRGSTIERERTWKVCAAQGVSARSLADKTVRTVREAERSNKNVQDDFKSIEKKIQTNDRTLMTLFNLMKHIDEQMKAARVISARATTKHGANNDHLAQKLLKRLDTDLSDIEDDVTKKGIKKEASSGDGQWLDTILWTSFLSQSEETKTVAISKKEPYSRRGAPLRQDYVEVPAESIDPMTNYSSALGYNTQILRKGFDFPFTNQKPIGEAVAASGMLPQDHAEEQSGASPSEKNTENNTPVSSANPFQIHVTTDPVKLKFHESWNPALNFASEIRGILSRTAGALSSTIKLPPSSTTFTTMLATERTHVADALQHAQARQERLAEASSSFKISFDRSKVHLRSLKTLLASQKKYYELARTQCETKLDVFNIMAEKRTRALQGVQRVLKTTKTVFNNQQNFTKDQVNSDIGHALEELTNMSKPLTKIRALATSPVPSLDNSAPLGGRDVGYDHTGEECAWRVQSGASYVSIADLFGVAPTSIVNTNTYIFHQRNTMYPPTGTWIRIPFPKFNNKECTWAPIGFSRLAQHKEPLSNLGFKSSDAAADAAADADASDTSDTSDTSDISDDDSLLHNLIATIPPSNMTNEEKEMVRVGAAKDKEEEKLVNKEDSLKEKELAESMLESYMNETKYSNKNSVNTTSNWNTTSMTFADSKDLQSPYEQNEVPKDLPKDLKDTLVAASILGKLRMIVESGEMLSDNDVSALEGATALPKSVRDKAVLALNSAKKSMQEMNTHPTKINVAIATSKQDGVQDISVPSLSVQEANDSNNLEKKEIAVKMTLAFNFDAITGALGEFKAEVALDVSTSLGIPGNGVEIASVVPVPPSATNQNIVSSTVSATSVDSFGVEAVIIIRSQNVSNVADKFVNMLKDPTSALRTSGPLSKVDTSTISVMPGGKDAATIMSALNDLDSSMKRRVDNVSKQLKEEVKEEEKVVLQEKNTAKKLEMQEKDKTAVVSLLLKKLQKKKVVATKQTKTKSPAATLKKARPKQADVKRGSPRFHASSSTTLQQESLSTLRADKIGETSDRGFLKFSGGDYMDMGTIGYEQMASNIHSEMTVSTWIRVHDIEEGKYSAIIAAVGEVNQQKRGFILGYGPHNGSPSSWVFGVRDVEGSENKKFTYARSNIPVVVSTGDTAAKWVHVVGVAGKDAVAIYIDGKHAGETARGKRGTDINFDITSSTYSLKPKLYLMAYGINGNVPPPPCCARADLSNTYVWNVAMNDMKEVDRESNSLPPPLISFDLSSKFLQSHSLTSGSAVTFGTTTGVYIQNDVASLSTVHTEKKTSMEAVKELSSGLNEKSKKLVLFDSRYNENDAKLLERVRHAMDTVNEAQIAFALATIIGGGTDGDVEAAIDEHNLMSGPVISISDIGKLIKYVVEAAARKRIDEGQLRAALLALPRVPSFSGAVDLFHALVVGDVPKITEIVPPSELTGDMQSGTMIKRIKQRASDETARVIKQKEFQMQKEADQKLSKKRTELSRISTDLHQKVLDAKGKQQRADATMETAVSLGKAVAQQHVQMNDWLTKQGFPPLQKTEADGDDKKSANNKDSALVSRVKESAAISISRMTMEALHAARDRRDKVCDSTKAATSILSTTKNIIKACRDATKAYEIAVEQNDRAKVKLTSVSNHLRRAVLERRGEYASFLNSTAHTSASMDQELQRMVHDESAARQLAMKASSSGNSDVANVYEERAVELQKQVEAMALKAVALRTRGDILDGTSPLLKSSLENGGKEEQNDPQWLLFAAHNLKLEESTKMMETEVKVRRASSSLQSCQRQRTTAGKDCKIERATLNKARAALLIAKSRLYSIEGIYAHGSVDTASQREEQLSKEKEAVVRASMHVEDQRLEAQMALNATENKVHMLENQLQQEREAKTYANSAMKQMEGEIKERETTIAYVRVALRFVKKMLTDSVSSRELFNNYVTTALATAFNTTESQIKIDQLEDVMQDNTKTAVGRLLRRRLRRRLLSRTRVPLNEALLRFRVMSEISTVDTVARTIQNAVANGVLEQYMEQEGVGRAVRIIGDITPVIRGNATKL